MTAIEKIRITKISQEFASGFEPDIPTINGSGWIVVDPLSGYLAAIEDIEQKLIELPANKKHGQVLVMIFPDGTQFIPAGADLGIDGVDNWHWIDP